MAKNYRNESMVDVAYGVLKDFQKLTKFRELYTEVSYRLEFTDDEKFENISKFYTDLTLDGRFVTLGENEWDLRERVTFKEANININDVYNEIEEEIKSNIDAEEYDEEELIAEGIKGEDDEEEETEQFDYDHPNKTDL